MGSRKKHKLDRNAKKQTVGNKKKKSSNKDESAPSMINKKHKIDDQKPGKQPRAHPRTIKLIDHTTGEVAAEQIQTIHEAESARKLRPKGALGKGLVDQDRIRPGGSSKQRRVCPVRKPRVQKNTTDACIADEKTKPWIKNYHGTLIQLGPDQKESKFFSDFLISDDSKEYSGWFIPSDNFYSIICKANEHFLPIQKGPLLTIKILDSLPSDMQLSSSAQNSITVKVANIVEEPYLINFPDGVKGIGNKWLLPENNDYISARKNYLNTKLSMDDSAVDDLLSMSYLKLFQEKTMNEAIRFKMQQYLDNFSTKLSPELLDEFFKIIILSARTKQLSLHDMLSSMVKTTLFLRNEFDMINKNLITKIHNGIIKPKQILDMSQEELLPELYYNPELDIQIKRDELYKKISKLVDEVVRNLAINILLYKMNIDRSKFWTQNRNLKQTQDDPYPFSIESNALVINDIVPLQNLCTTKQMQETGKQITLEDIDDLGGVIFYKDQNGQLYCFTLSDIKKIIDNNTAINPLSGLPFSKSFQLVIKKLNLERVGGAGYVHPWHPSTLMTGEIFGDSSDDDDYSGDIYQTDARDDVSVVYPPFIGAYVSLTALTSVEGQKLNGVTGTIAAFDVEKQRWSIKLDQGGTKKVKAGNLHVIPTPPAVDPNTLKPIENNTLMSLKYGVGVDGNVLTAPLSAPDMNTGHIGSLRSGKPGSTELVDPGFIDYIEKLITTMQLTGHQFNFEAIEQDAKDAAKTQYCFGCSKRLSDDSKWSSTVNLNKKNGGFEKNTFHIKCLYNTSFKV